MFTFARHGTRMQHHVLATAGTQAPRPGHCRDECSASWPLQGRMQHHVLVMSGTQAPRPGHCWDECTMSWPLQGRMHHVLATSWPLQGRMHHVLAIAGTNAAPCPGHVRDAGTTCWPLQGRMHRVLATSGTQAAPCAGHRLVKHLDGETKATTKEGTGTGREQGHMRGFTSPRIFWTLWRKCRK